MQNEQDALLPITVVVPFTDEENRPMESRFTGYLTGDSHAMYVDPEYGHLFFTRVQSTHEPLTFTSVSAFTILGRVQERETGGIIIAKLSKQLHDMTAYQFMTVVMVNLVNEVDFEDWIIPKLLAGGDEF